MSRRKVVYLVVYTNCQHDVLPHLMVYCPASSVWIRNTSPLEFMASSSATLACLLTPFNLRGGRSEGD